VLVVSVVAAAETVVSVASLSFGDMQCALVCNSSCDQCSNLHCLPWHIRTALTHYHQAYKCLVCGCDHSSFSAKMFPPPPDADANTNSTTADTTSSTAASSDTAEAEQPDAVAAAVRAAVAKAAAAAEAKPARKAKQPSAQQSAKHSAKHTAKQTVKQRAAAAAAGATARPKLTRQKAQRDLQCSSSDASDAAVSEEAELAEELPKSLVQKLLPVLSNARFWLALLIVWTLLAQSIGAHSSAH
jgi:pyruvate/2-oxoglutarate dehydrogenase complex dihydrolipoamide acyltransferase (E2) component